LDTKLKNYKYSAWLKLLAIALCVAGMLTLAYGLLKAPYFETALQNTEQNTDYKESMRSKELLIQTYNNISNIAFSLKDEEYIKSGKALDNNIVNDRTSSLQTEKAIAIQEIEANYDQSIQKYVAGEIDTSSIPNTSGTSIDSKEEYNQKAINDLQTEKNNLLKQYNKKYDDSIKEIKTDYINEQLSDYQRQLDNLNENTGIYYTIVENNKATMSNIVEASSVEDFYKGLPNYVQLTQSNINAYFSTYYNSSLQSIPDNTVVYLGMSKEKYNTEILIFSQNLKDGLWGIRASSVGLLVFLLGLFYIIYAAGRRVDGEGVQLIAIDHVYLDVALGLSLAAIALCMAPLFEFGRYFFTDAPHFNTNLLLVLFGVIISIGTLIGILYLAMFSKRVKRHEVIKHTLIFKVITWILRKIKSICADLFSNMNSVFDKSPMVMRLVLIFGAYAVIIMICILMFLAGPLGVLMGFAGIVGTNVVATYFLLKIFKTFKEIKDGAERIRAGELSYIIPEHGIPELRQLSETINKIADGLKNVVSSQVKAERMKSELITNVSHDLKTPLTSIITYVDLLKNEGLQSENADKYLGIIDTKSQRLKALTEDLFEAAKVASGSIPVNLERLNIVSLINQGLVELSDKVEASGLGFKISLPSEKLFVTADGKLLWRVIENLLSNVFKYALPGSRVYIDAAAHDDMVSIVIKNISAYELNINEDELMERFKRGDESRNSEGSGLGLSIAKSLTALQGGNFTINIDGDLFKATIVLPISK